MNILKRFFAYLFFRNTGNDDENFNLKLMNRTNRIAIIMFVVCLIVLIYKCSR